MQTPATVVRRIAKPSIQVGNVEFQVNPAFRFAATVSLRRQKTVMTATPSVKMVAQSLA
jgi:hypothetical protein